MELGYKIYLIEDACATKDLKWKDQIISSHFVQSSFFSFLNGTFANVTSGDAIIKVINT